MTVGNEVKLVIFDKDGTLVDFHRMWLPWAANTVQLLERATARPVGPAVYKTLGVDPIQGRMTVGNEVKLVIFDKGWYPGRFSSYVATMGLRIRYNCECTGIMVGVGFYESDIKLGFLD
ncbi:hypothetical protein OSTOST_07856 [Ostertagia ostertagi]